MWTRFIDTELLELTSGFHTLYGGSGSGIGTDEEYDMESVARPPTLGEVPALSALSVVTPTEVQDPPRTNSASVFFFNVATLGSGDTSIDSLLHGSKWGTAPGAGIELPVSFSTAESRYHYYDDPAAQGVVALTPAQIDGARAALTAWARVSAITFVEVAESGAIVGDIRWSATSAESVVTAYGVFPSPSALGGDIWFGPNHGGFDEPVPGNYDYHAFLHELGHALGLGHPHQAAIPPASEEDQLKYSVMSYRSYPGAALDSYQGWIFPTTPMLNDVLAAQFLYGVNFQESTEDTAYVWDAAAYVFETIFDTGGIDTIDAANQAQSVSLRLEPGLWSSIGVAFYNGQEMVRDCLTIAYGCVIENAIGSAFNDSLLGNSAANRLEGGAGGDVLNGGVGADTLVGGPGSDNYYFDNLGDVALETDPSASGGVDTAYTSVNIAALAVNVENVRLVGTGALNAAGNGLNNVFYANAGDNLLDGAAGIDTVSYVYAMAGVNVSLVTSAAQATGGSGNDILRSIEYLTGSPFADTLSGNTGFNSLDGGAGADTLSGGAADDNYTVDNAGDVVIETDPVPGFGGIDTVYASLNYTLPANVENLRLVPATALNGTGNTLNNTLFAGNGNNLLDGAGGIDLASYAFATSAVRVSLAAAEPQATGGSGRDTLVNIEGLAGSAFNDSLGGSTGNDLLYGSAGLDTLNGGAGQDVLDGQAGADSMSGGDGGDNYTIDDAGDLTVETNASAAGGIDTAYTYVNHTLQANVENARILTPGAANLNGNALANVIYAGRGDNVIDGGAGTDTVTYLYQLGGVNISLASTNPQNTLGSGTDTLRNLENITGTNFADNLTGTAGANILDGGLGADILIGGDGNDLYLVDNPADNLIETLTGGTDLVYVTASYALQANLENLRQTGAGNIDATGNGLNNVIYAGTGNNVLNGQGGSDTINFAYASSAVIANLATGQANGGSGSDTLSNFENLSGSGFADTLTGNAQANTLTGGAGADLFVLNSVLASDTISDFLSGSDKVRISQAGISIGNGDTTVNNAASIAGPGGFATTAELVIVTGNIAAAITATSAAAAIGNASSAYAIGAKALFVVDNGSSSAAYDFTAADANAAVSAAELTLLAGLSNVASTSVADWVFG